MNIYNIVSYKVMPLIYNTESLNDFNNLNNINLKFYSKKKKIRIWKNNDVGNINQNVFKKMMNKKAIINPESIVSSNIKYNYFDDLPNISKNIPLSPLLSPRKLPIKLKMN